MLRNLQSHHKMGTSQDLWTRTLALFAVSLPRISMSIPKTKKEKIHINFMNYKYCITTTVNKQNNKNKQRKCTRFRQSICILFLWRIFKTPGGCSHALPSTCNSLHNLSQMNFQGKEKFGILNKFYVFGKKNFVFRPIF